MSKRKRTRYLDAYGQSPAPSIDLPLTLENFRDLLIAGARPDGRYTHQQIKDWAARFWGRHIRSEPVDPTLKAPEEIRLAANLAQEIEAQWDMFLVNTYKPSELQHLDFSQVRLPYEWFADWLAQLNRVISRTSVE